MEVAYETKQLNEHSADKIEIFSYWSSQVQQSSLNKINCHNNNYQLTIIVDVFCATTK